MMKIFKLLADAKAPAACEWIEATLKASTAPHVIVAGHYPVYSICEHGPTSLLVSDLKPLLEKYNVSAYLNGHDHCAEHFVEAPDRPAAPT